MREPTTPISQSCSVNARVSTWAGPPCGASWSTPGSAVRGPGARPSTGYVPKHKHRVRRQRMPREGMLIQLDGSYHRWLGEDGPQFTILFAVDDATGCVAGALSCDHENTSSYFLLMQGLIRRRGIPLALYTHRHAVLKHRSEYQPDGTTTQFGRATEELGTQLIFARSPQAKGRVERTAGTLQDRLVTELRLARAATLEEAKAVLKQFLPRFNRRFGVPPKSPESAFRPVEPGPRLGQVLCFKHRRRVARDNTVKFHRHTLQLLPGRQRRSYAGAVVVVPEGLDGRLSLQHEGRIIASQEAPPSPASLRSRNATSPAATIPTHDSELASKPLVTTLDLPGANPDQEAARAAAIDDPDVAGLRVVASPRRPTFLQQERWKAVQQAKLPQLPPSQPTIPELASKPLVTTLDLPGANPDQEAARAAAIDDPDVAGLRVVASPRRPTFLQQERWKAVQQAKLQGMSIRRMTRELGIHRDTVRSYIDAGTPPTRRTPAIPPAPASDTIARLSKGHFC